jgi:hypothetical protein
MTTTNPIRKMMPTALPKNLSMRLSGELIPGECGFWEAPAVGYVRWAESVNW